VAEVDKWQQPPIPYKVGLPAAQPQTDANSQRSTGPRTESGKQRSSRYALRHGLAAQTAVLPNEDPEAFQRHIQQFVDEYAPATATETQLVHEIANTAWRLNRSRSSKPSCSPKTPIPRP